MVGFVTTKRAIESPFLALLGTWYVRTYTTDYVLHSFNI